MKFIHSADDQWHALPEDADLASTVQRPPPYALLTLPQWEAVQAHWPVDLPVGLRIANTCDVETLQAHLPRLSLIALEFPKWIDGRAYSQARLLRSRLQYRGEIRAVGDVLVDMLPLLQRTGFNAVQMRADQNVDYARKALGFFEQHYQGDVTQTRPHFSRLAA